MKLIELTNTSTVYGCDLLNKPHRALPLVRRRVASRPQRPPW